MFDIRYGLYLIIFLMPFYLARFSILGIPTTFLEIAIYIIFIVWLFREMRSASSFSALLLVFKKERILSYGIILLFSGLLISTAYSSDVRTSLGVVKGWFFDPLLFFLVLISCIKEKKDVISMLSAWALSGFAVAIVSVGYLLADKLTFDGRLSAFYLSPNHLAMYLSPVLLIGICLLSQKDSGFLKNIEQEAKLPIGSLASLIVMIILIPLFFTHSYGAFLGLSAGLFYVFGKHFFDKNRLKKSKSIFVAFLAILFFGVILGLAKIDQIENSSGRSSFHSRLMIWSTSYEMIKESPIIGIGPGTFEEKYLSLADSVREPYLEWAVPQPHNIFLAFYLQTGFIGFIGFMMILAWFFQTNRKKNSNYIQFRISNISACLMIYILVHGLIDTTYWKNDLALMFWLVIGLSAIGSKNQAVDMER